MGNVNERLRWTRFRFFLTHPNIMAILEPSDKNTGRGDGDSEKGEYVSKFHVRKSVKAST